MIRNAKAFKRQGPGGRSSNEGDKSKLIAGLTATIFGASGMLGRTLTNSLGLFCIYKRQERHDYRRSVPLD